MPEPATEIIPLDQVIQRYVSVKHWMHDQGECAGKECPWCEYECQFPGKPHYRLSEQGRCNSPPVRDGK